MKKNRKVLVITVSVILVVLALMVWFGNTEPINWSNAKQENKIRSYTAYLSRHPNGPHAVEAREMLNALAAENTRQKEIIRDVRPLIDKCNKLGDVPVTIRGKCLVWDVTRDDINGAHDVLPREIIATSSEKQITIFLVMSERDVQIGTYGISGQPAYRKHIDVCVAYWPEKEAVGMHSVVMRAPPSSRRVSGQPEYGSGDPDRFIAEWIRTLPRTY